MADFRDEPRLGCERRYCLLLDRLSDGRRPEGDRMTGLRDGDVVLPSILAEERALFPFEQVGEIQSAYGHIDFKFSVRPSFLFLVFFCS